MMMRYYALMEDSVHVLVLSKCWQVDLGKTGI